MDWARNLDVGVRGGWTVAGTRIQRSASGVGGAVRRCSEEKGQREGAKPRGTATLEAGQQLGGTESQGRLSKEPAGDPSCEPQLCSVVSVNQTSSRSGKAVNLTPTHPSAEANTRPALPKHGSQKPVCPHLVLC